MRSQSRCVCFKTYHPSEPEAGFAGCTQCDVQWSHIRGRLQGLDLSRRLAGWAGAHNIHLTHTKSADHTHTHIHIKSQNKQDDHDGSDSATIYSICTRSIN